MPQTHTFHHKARKRFGQNFLHDQGVIRQIVRCIHPDSAVGHLVEIGPGQGALTRGIMAETDELDVIELDRDLIPLLKLHFGLNKGFRIFEHDAMKFDFSQLKTDERPLRLVGNLPYNISTPLIFHFLKYRHIVRDMHFMLQKEVVDRLAAEPCCKDYGRLSIMTQYYCYVEKLFVVKPGSFKPAPKVDSAIVRIVPHKTLPFPCQDEKILDQVVRESFSQRRKTIRNTLKRHTTSDELSSLGIDPGARPETLSIQEFVAISNYLVNRK